MKQYDVIFCGLGVGACLLIRELERRQLLGTYSICIIDPVPKTKNDKTLCFWSAPDAELTQENADIISRSWSKARVPPFREQSLSPYTYHQIESVRLYESTYVVLKKYNIQIVQSRVHSIQHSERGPCVTGSFGEFRAKKIYDSRPPSYLKSLSNPLLQSFLGVRVQTQEDHFDPETFVLMDFSIPQLEHTQFMYILPEDSRTALIECTRFGTETIPWETAQALLDEYITERFGAFSTLSEERGVIPMIENGIHEEKIPGVQNLGTRAGAVKSSTGYAFETMFEHAKSICNAIDQEHIPIPKKTRHSFYDRLLLDILDRQPHLGKTIFLQLFQHQSIANVFRFLHERSRIIDEASIFARLPWPPFLKAASRDFLRQSSGSRSTLILAFVTVLYLLVQPILPTITTGLMYAALFLGLVLIGIPHGAVDHKTIRPKGVQPWNPLFLLAYLGVMGLMACVWLIAPYTALGIFLLASAWHFGQTEFESWKINRPILSFFWGSSLLTAIMGTHLDEVIPLLGSLDIHIPQTMQSVGWPLAIFCIVGSIFAALLCRSGRWLASIFLVSAGLMAPLPISFGIYFVGQHSWTAWKDLRKAYSSDEDPLWIHALPFTTGAFFLFFAMLFFFTEEITHYHSALVIFVSSISLPHILCMNQFYQKWQKKSGIDSYEPLSTNNDRPADTYYKAKQRSS